MNEQGAPELVGSTLAELPLAIMSPPHNESSLFVTGKGEYRRGRLMQVPEGLPIL